MGKFRLGETLKDKITGFEGIVMARTEYLTGCVHYGLLNPKLERHEKRGEWYWLDEIQLKRIKKRRIKL